MKFYMQYSSLTGFIQGLAGPFFQNFGQVSLTKQRYLLG